MGNAGQPSTTQTVQVPAAHRPTLTFTGLALGLVVLSALALTGVGLFLRRAGHAKAG